MYLQPGTPGGRAFEAPTPGASWSAPTPGASFSEAGTPTEPAPTYGMCQYHGFLPFGLATL
jgi:hypothetical protein